MPRTARQIATSGIYHIMLRGINRQEIFTDDTDRQRTIVTQAATQGAAINQLARITGLSYRQVYKTVKNK